MGFTWGQVRIAQLLDDEMEDYQISGQLATHAQAFASGTTMVIPFQNENLCAYLEDQSGSRCVRGKYLFIPSLTNLFRFQIAASVPDLITILDSQSGSHLGTSECKLPLSPIHIFKLNLFCRYIRPTRYRWDMLFLSRALLTDSCSNCSGLPSTLA